jgi:hypothetical protein
MNRDLDRLVDECFTRMQTDGWSVEQCLEAYPQYREVLKPLLMIGSAMQVHLAPDPPSIEFARNSKIRIENLMRSQSLAEKRRSSTRVKRRTRWYLRPAYVLASAALVVALLASGFSVVSASAASLPGDTLYGIKLAREEVALAFSLSAQGDQELLVRFAEERLEEVEALIEQNRFDDIPSALLGYESTLTELEGLTDKTEELQPVTLEHLQSRLENHIQVLQRVIDNAPESAHEGLENALEKSSHSREVLESIHGDGHPSENAPGQNKSDEKENKQGDPDDENQDESQPGNSGRGRGPTPKAEREKGPPPWANND